MSHPPGTCFSGNWSPSTRGSQAICGAIRKSLAYCTRMCRVLHLQDQPHEALEGGFILDTTLSGDAKESLLPGRWHMVHDIWCSPVKRLGLLIRSRWRICRPMAHDVSLQHCTSSRLSLMDTPLLVLSPASWVCRPFARSVCRFNGLSSDFNASLEGRRLLCAWACHLSCFGVWWPLSLWCRGKAASSSSSCTSVLAPRGMAF